MDSNISTFNNFQLSLLKITCRIEVMIGVEYFTIKHFWNWKYYACMYFFPLKVNLSATSKTILLNRLGSFVYSELQHIFQAYDNDKWNLFMVARPSFSQCSWSKFEISGDPSHPSIYPQLTLSRTRYITCNMLSQCLDTIP
jgi:hypothetical protein